MTRTEENKLIERTSKYHAYMRAYCWAKWAKNLLDTRPEYGDAAWYCKEKMEGHREWLAQQKFRYEFATSTFIPNDGFYNSKESE